MKKLFSVFKNIVKNKKIVISIISILSLVGMYTLYDYSFNKPTVINSFIAEIEDWLNNYPRAMFDYKGSNMLLLNI